MSPKLQQYIISLIENHDGTTFGQNSSYETSSFFGVVYKHGMSIQSVSAAQDYLSLISFNIVFSFASDIILYVGIIFLVTQLGYNSKFKPHLAKATLYSNCKWLLKFCAVILLIQCAFLVSSADASGATQSLIIFSGTYSFNIYTQFAKLVIVFGTLVLFPFLEYAILGRKLSNVDDLSILFFMNACFACLVISSTHFVLTLLALEGFSLILYIMTTIDRTQGGVSASVKYFTFGTLGSILLFWGMVHIYAVIPSLSYNVIFFLYDYINTNFYSEVRVFDSLEFAASMIVLGFAIKLGAAPFHAWVADVYTGSHLLVTAYFATVVKFVLFTVFCYISYHFNTGNIVDFAAVCSLVVGSIITLRQTEIKRFIAYSSITHVGFLLIGDLTSGFVYILTYLISSLAFFSVLLSINNNDKELIYLNDLTSIKKSGLFKSALLVASLASMAGLPPFAGFYGKFLIWSSLVEDIYLYNDFSSYVLLIVSVAFSLVSIFYYVRVMAYIFVGSDFITPANVDHFTKLINALDKQIALMQAAYDDPILGAKLEYEATFTRIQWVWASLLLGWTLVHPFVLQIISYINSAISQI